MWRGAAVFKGRSERRRRAADCVRGHNPLNLMENALLRRRHPESLAEGEPQRMIGRSRCRGTPSL